MNSHELKIITVKKELEALINISKASFLGPNFESKKINEDFEEEFNKTGKRFCLEETILILLLVFNCFLTIYALVILYRLKLLIYNLILILVLVSTLLMYKYWAAFKKASFSKSVLQAAFNLASAGAALLFVIHLQGDLNLVKDLEKITFYYILLAIFANYLQSFFSPRSRLILNLINFILIIVLNILVDFLCESFVCIALHSLLYLHSLKTETYTKRFFLKQKKSECMNKETRCVLDELPVGYCKVDSQFKIIEHNKVFQQNFSNLVLHEVENEVVNQRNRQQESDYLRINEVTVLSRAVGVTFNRRNWETSGQYMNPELFVAQTDKSATQTTKEIWDKIPSQDGNFSYFKSIKSENGDNNDMLMQKTGENIKLVFFCTDELSKRQAAITENKFKNLILAKVYHEFKAPIMFMQNTIDNSLEKDTITKLNALHDVKYLSEIVLLLIDDLNEYANLHKSVSNTSAGNSMFELEDLQGYITNMCGALLLIYNKNITIRTCFDEHPSGARITTDEKKVKQILTNLISNAIKNTIEGEITITLKMNNNADSNNDNSFSVSQSRPKTFGNSIAPKTFSAAQRRFFSLTNRDATSSDNTPTNIQEPIVNKNSKKRNSLFVTNKRDSFLRTASSLQGFCIIIEDSGPGIEDGIARSINFDQSEDVVMDKLSTKELNCDDELYANTKGMGMGLKICKKLSKELGVKITCSTIKESIISPSQRPNSIQPNRPSFLDKESTPSQRILNLGTRFVLNFSNEIHYNNEELNSVTTKNNTNLFIEYQDKAHVKYDSCSSLTENEKSIMKSDYKLSLTQNANQANNYTELTEGLRVTQFCLQIIRKDGDNRSRTVPYKPQDKLGISGYLARSSLSKAQTALETKKNSLNSNCLLPNWGLKRNSQSKSRKSSYIFNNCLYKRTSLGTESETLNMSNNMVYVDYDVINGLVPSSSYYQKGGDVSMNQLDCLSEKEESRSNSEVSKQDQIVLKNPVKEKVSKSSVNSSEVKKRKRGSSHQFTLGSPESKKSRKFSGGDDFKLNMNKVRKSSNKSYMTDNSNSDNEKKVKQPKILVVDDNSSNQNAIEKLVLRYYKNRSSTPYVLKLNDGIELVNEIYAEIKNNGRFVTSIIFSDEMMEFMNGSEAFKIILKLATDKKLPPIPFVICSAFNQEGHRSRMQSVGIEHIYEKPLSVGNVEFILDNILKKSRG